MVRRIKGTPVIRAKMSCVASSTTSTMSPANQQEQQRQQQRQRRLPPTPPLYKHKRRQRGLLSLAKSTIRMLFQQPALVLNEEVTLHGSSDDDRTLENQVLTKLEMLNIAEEVLLRIGELYAIALNVDEETGKVTVDYVKLMHSIDFWRYVQAVKKLRHVDPTRLHEEERMAFFLNLYNALMIHGIVTLPRGRTVFARLSIFDTAAYNIGGRIYTLNDIEHGILRANKGSSGAFGTPQFEEGDARTQCALPSVDPRIHFALNCGARSCPSLRFYNPDNLNEALDAAARNFLFDMQVDTEKREVVLSQILRWYQDDFAKGGVYEVLKWTLPYLERKKHQELKTLLDDHESGKAFLKVVYANYDWSLNDSFFLWQ